MIRPSGMAMAKKMMAKLIAKQEVDRGVELEVQNAGHRLHDGRMQKGLLLSSSDLGVSCVAGVPRWNRSSSRGGCRRSWRCDPAWRRARNGAGQRDNERDDQCSTARKRGKKNASSKLKYFNGNPRQRLAERRGRPGRQDRQPRPEWPLRPRRLRPPVRPWPGAPSGRLPAARRPERSRARRSTASRAARAACRPRRAPGADARHIPGLWLSACGDGLARVFHGAFRQGAALGQNRRQRSLDQKLIRNDQHDEEQSRRNGADQKLSELLNDILHGGTGLLQLLQMRFLASGTLFCTKGRPLSQRSGGHKVQVL